MTTSSFADKKSPDRQHQAERISPESSRQLCSDGPYASIMMLQKTAGNRTVNQLLRAGTTGSLAEAAEGALPSIVSSALQHSNGQPLDPATRTLMESRFGENLSHVRVHTSRQAAESAELLGAKAYTVGHNIFFREGRYQPGALAGNRLLTHELTHVIQQSRTPPASTPYVHGLGGAAEDEADHAADMSVRSPDKETQIKVAQGVSFGIQRSPDDGQDSLQKRFGRWVRAKAGTVRAEAKAVEDRTVRLVQAEIAAATKEVVAVQNKANVRGEEIKTVLTAHVQGAKYGSALY